MNEVAPRTQPGDRILVALDASPHSIAALKAAVELAALLDAELDALFVEDINLLRLCNLPFSQEIGSYSGRVRRLDHSQIERQLRTLAGMIERTVSQVTLRTPVRWRFHVRRGPVVEELLNAAQQAALLSLGRAGRARRKSLGSTAQSLVHRSPRPLLILGEEGGLRNPLTVVYTGSPASQRAVNLAAHLAARGKRPVQVLLLRDKPTDEGMAHPEVEARILLGEAAGELRPVTQRELVELLNKRDGGTLILPNEHAALMSEFDGPTILVP